ARASKRFASVAQLINKTQQTTPISGSRSEPASPTISVRTEMTLGFITEESPVEERKAAAITSSSARAASIVRPGAKRAITESELPSGAPGSIVRGKYNWAVSFAKAKDFGNTPIIT